ncbi:MAG: hypothetical protein QOG97_3700 [Acidimicrobiaceae bacterium]|jgi:hypothetical protein|nr:hypothetical protein [Acidimicrobiaceae bacterium]
MLRAASNFAGAGLMLLFVGAVRGVGMKRFVNDPSGVRREGARGARLVARCFITAGAVSELIALALVLLSLIR